MKLIFCPKCQDVVKLQKTHRGCICAESWGQYKEDGLNAVIGGRAIPLGFSNPSFAHALRGDTCSISNVFQAFVIPMPCPTIEREKL